MVPPADVPLKRPHKEASHRRVCVALVACLLVCSSARLEPVRWWWSAPIVSSLAVTPEQSTTIERLYETGLPARRSASEDVISLTEKVALRLTDGVYDGELLKLTSQLVNARWNECEQRRRSLALSAKPLSEGQRERLTQLIRNGSVAE